MIRNKVYKTKLSLSEVTYIMFKKKICPKCRSKMKKNVLNSKIGEGDIAIGGGPRPITYKDAEIYGIDIYYKCDSCDEIYNIKQLTQKQ